MANTRIPILKPFMPAGIMPKIKETLYSGWIGEGPKVRELENALVAYTGNPYTVCLNSGTSAIHLALFLAGVGPGDEVISTPMTCAATNLPIVHTGAKIVWADINDYDANINVADVAEKITKRTKAIVFVDYGGNPADVDQLQQLARKHNIKLIEDAAQALGAQLHGRPIGTYADYTCFSLQSVKSITSVDGGILCLKSLSDYRRAKRLRWFGIDRDNHYEAKRPWLYKISEPGFKFHMNDVLATIGLAQLPYLKQILRHQRQNALYYTEALKDLPITTVPIEPHKESSWWLFHVLTKKRYALRDFLLAKGIETTPIHFRNDRLSVFKAFRTKLPNVDRFNNHHLAIPNGYWVGKKEREHIVHSIHEFFKKT